MDKKFLFIVLLSLSSCSFGKIEKEELTPIIEENVEVIHEYFEVEDKIITWKLMFSVDSSKYFIYFYSENCEHCENLKQWIIEEALTRKNIYFVKNSRDVKFIKNTNSTIGATTVEEIGILGFPSLIEIDSKRVIKNVAGATQIKEILNSE